MFFFVLAHVWSALLDLIWCGRHAERDKDIEILLLPQQLRILQRKQPLYWLLSVSAYVIDADVTM